MASTRSRTPLIIGIVAGITCLAVLLVIVLVVVAGGVTFWSASDERTGPGSSAPSEPAPGGLELPPGVAEDQPYLELSTSEDGPVVDVYVDFLCPHCAAFHEAQGEDLQQLAQDGEITLRLHPRAMLDTNSTPPGYSSRAANAAVCAYAEEPTQWFAAESALFTDQPDAAGLTDDELATRLTEATGLEVADCIAEGTYLPWIQDVVEPEAVSTGQGTPAVFVDGELLTADFTEPGALEKELAAR